MVHKLVESEVSRWTLEQLFWRYGYTPESAGSQKAKNRLEAIRQEINYRIEKYADSVSLKFRGFLRAVKSKGANEIIDAYLDMLHFEFHHPITYRLQNNDRLVKNRWMSILPIILKGDNLEILDAGCGFGSDAILFGLIGAKVLGIDVFPGLVETTQKRVRLYEELLGAPMDVTCINENILNMSITRQFDIIWSNESIEHIHPVKEFLKVAFQRLKNGGKLIICNDNGLNLYNQLKLFIKRGVNLYIPGDKLKDPRTNRSVRYANERILPAPWLKGQLTQIGFAIEKVLLKGFVPSFSVSNKLIYSFTKRFDSFLESMPLLRWFAKDYVIVARKD